MNFQLSSSETRISILIVGVILFFYLYYYTAHSVFFVRFAERRYKNQSQKELYRFFMQKLTGFVFLGLLPGILYYFFVDHSMDKYGFSLSLLRSNISTILLLSGIIGSILFLTQKVKPERNSLQIKWKEWTISMFVFNALGWTLYLVGYEFLFRGIFLNACFNDFGFWPAIAINVVIYSAIHMVNGKDQAIGALVFGTIACYFTLTKGTLLIPVFMHISLSVFSDYFSIRLNPNLRFVKSETIDIPSR
ncbi:CPBP family intramembrane glutamic endopeptidase [Maribellus maritimus]|uniref:CPBP family intramembrane glutamic endopeptidase n=1 Tax=Maribellus maritimus TaxID=2870838 RepID=UPI001EEA3493|nr:CPBP family intramembrane glutamic endopeptidase [Maribellus maritimus]MCG6189637.1 CPBP family intramembrane metalloprotease [Maribellus maritimus]